MKTSTASFAKTYCLELSGDFACFTRPEMKVERVSYDVMTPSAARACFEAILWKPAIRWHIRKIEVLKPIRWMKNGTGILGLNIEDDRQQRAGLFLRDVAYRVHADLEVLPNAAPDNTPMKFQEMFERRASRGQCVNQPYLGCREFAAHFRLVADLAAEPAPIGETRDLGFMLHDMDFTNATDPAPRFFRARLESGAVNVPAWDSEEVRG
jgi:CRISPR-associated protein Cas5d